MDTKINKKWLIVGCVVLFVLWIGGSFAGTYNRFVALQNDIDGQWAQVENQLQRRNDLIPNLVNVVKSYAKHEKAVFLGIADARAKLAGAKTVNEKVKANNEITSAISRLLVVMENYPVLQANKNFLSLQDQLEGTENRIAVERQRFNELVKTYNKKRQSFPANIFASILKFEANKDYIEVSKEKQEVPKVDFTE